MFTLRALPFLLVLTPALGHVQDPQGRPTFEQLKAFYAVPDKAPGVTENKIDSPPGSQVSKISFTGPDGSAVTGNFFVPTSPGKHPLVLLLHGLTDNADRFSSDLAPAFLKSGVAVLALDAPHHGHRTTEADKKMFGLLFQAAMAGFSGNDLAGAIAAHDPGNTIMPWMLSIISGGVKENELALNWLASRSDIDMGHVGMMGYSMGSFEGPILTAVDTRISAAVFCVGGDPVLPLADKLLHPTNSSHPQDTTHKAQDISLTRAYEVCPSLFIGHDSPRPILMLNGKQDNIVPPASNQRLYDAAKEPKQIKWFNSGHMLPPEAMQEGVSWLVQHLN